MEFLNGCRVGQVHFKDCLTVNSDIYCFDCGLKGRALKAKVSERTKNLENFLPLEIQLQVTGFMK